MAEETQQLELRELPDDIYENMRSADETVDDFVKAGKVVQRVIRKKQSDSQKLERTKTVRTTLNADERTRFQKYGESLFAGGNKKLQEIKRGQDFMKKMRAVGSKDVAPEVKPVKQVETKAPSPRSLFQILFATFTAIFAGMLLFNSDFRHKVLGWTARKGVAIIKGIYKFITVDIPKLIRVLPKKLMNICENLVAMFSSDSPDKKSYVKEVISTVLDQAAVVIAKIAQVIERNTRKARDIMKIVSATASGIGTGAAIGSAFAGVGALPGAIIGGIIGLVVGIVDVYLSKEKEKDNLTESYDKWDKRVIEVTKEISQIQDQLKYAKGSKQILTLNTMLTEKKNELSKIQAATKQLSLATGKVGLSNGEAASKGTELTAILRSVGLKEGDDFELGVGSGDKKSYVKRLGGLSLDSVTPDELMNKGKEMIMEKLEKVVKDNEILKGKTDEEVITIMKQVSDKAYKSGTKSLTAGEQQMLRDLQNVSQGMSESGLKDMIEFLATTQKNQQEADAQIKKNNEALEKVRLKHEVTWLKENKQYEKVISNNKYVENFNREDITKKFQFNDDIDKDKANGTKARLMKWLGGSKFNTNWKAAISSAIIKPIKAMFESLQSLIPEKEVIANVTKSVSLVKEGGMYINIDISTIKTSDEGKTAEVIKNVQEQGKRACENYTKASDEVEDITIYIEKGKFNFSTNTTSGGEKVKEKIVLPEVTVPVFIDERKNNKPRVISCYVADEISDTFSEQGSNVSNNGEGGNGLQVLSEEGGE